MGLFKKKHDPIADRAAALNQKIAALESEIRTLASQQEKIASESATAPPRPKAAPTPSPFASAPATPAAAPALPGPTARSGSQARIRSTAKSRSQVPPSVASSKAAPADEPIFEEVDHVRLQEQQEEATSGHFNELGVRKYDFAAVWRRARSHFRGPATNNPKLVNYLAAGSIQGLRPMRYEKRVARNRFIFFVVLLALAMWGLIVIFMKGTR